MSCKCVQAGACPWHHCLTTPESLQACKEGTSPSSTWIPCVYLGKSKAEENLYECRLLKECTLKRNNLGIASCQGCKHRKVHTDEMADFVDPLFVYDRNAVRTDALRGSLAGRAAFLVCGGPSLKTLDLTRLQRRGVWSMGVNNVAGMAPVDSFVCSDPPTKFSDAIWMDPKIRKFVPLPKLSRHGRGKIRLKREGEFVDTHLKTMDCPEIWAFDRRSWLAMDDTFFTEPSAAWGNQKDGIERLGLPDGDRVAMTMLLGIRLLYYLGARVIFLLGVDFYMDPKAKLRDNYAFGQERDMSAITSNNRHFQIVSKVLTDLRPVFERFGLYVFNCNPISRLRAFDHVPYDEAIEACAKDVQEFPDLEGWYQK